MMINEGLFSNNTNEWYTPQRLFDKLNNEFQFTLDPCATKESAKCGKYFTKEDDGLSHSWKGHSVFMNPPYGREIKHWMEKAYIESRDSNTIVVCLIPSRTCTKWWHDYCMRANLIRFVRGRIKFVGGRTKSSGEYPAPFPSAIVIFEGTVCCCPLISTWDSK